MTALKGMTGALAPFSYLVFYNHQNDKYNTDNTLIERCHPLDGITNLKYKLLHFLTPNKITIQRERYQLLTMIDAAI
jgi:hypothetical protein